MDREVLLALDYGRRRIGVAKSDALGILAHPMATIVVREGVDVFDHLNVLVRETQAARIVVGRPIFLKGSSSAMTHEVERFAQVLGQRVGLPVILVDERLTSQEAGRHLIEGGVKARKRKAVRDSLAAQILLQQVLDSERRTSCTKSQSC